MVTPWMTPLPCVHYLCSPPITIPWKRHRERKEGGEMAVWNDVKTLSTVNSENRRTKEGNSRVIVAKKIMNQKDRRQWVSYMDILTKVKEIQIRHRMDTISYHTSREQQGSGVWETMSGVEKGRQNNRSWQILHSIAARGNEWSKTFVQTRQRDA